MYEAQLLILGVRLPDSFEKKDLHENDWKYGFSVHETARIQIEHSFKIVICKNSTKAFEEREMNVNKLASMLTTAITGFVVIMSIAGNSAAFADNGTQSVSMLLLNLPYFLILMVGAGVIGSIVFLFIVGAEVLRRRRRKYSCIQH